MTRTIRWRVELAGGVERIVEAEMNGNRSSIKVKGGGIMGTGTYGCTLESFEKMFYARVEKNHPSAHRPVRLDEGYTDYQI